MDDKDPEFVPTSDLLRPLPPCGAGEEDFQLDARQATRAGPLPPRVAGERDSQAGKVNRGMPRTSALIAEESDSPAGQAGRGRNSHSRNNFGTQNVTVHRTPLS